MPENKETISSGDVSHLAKYEWARGRALGGGGCHQGLDQGLVGKLRDGRGRRCSAADLLERPRHSAKKPVMLQS